MLGLYSFVFNRVFNVPVPRYPEFLFAALLPWVFLSQSISASISSLSAEADLIRRAPFRYELVPISMVLSMAMYLLVTLVGFCAYLAIHGRLAWELLPVLLVPTASVVLFACGIGQIVALFDIYNRDLRWVVGNLLTVWFFMLPIVYRREMVPESLHFLESTDPMNMIIGQFRSILYFQEVSRPFHLGLMFVVCVMFFIVCRAVFRRLSTELAKDI
jgi:ABC-type polysaccharide/polyol phosphate export permease